MSMKYVLIPAVIVMALAGCGGENSVASLPVEKSNRCALDLVQGSKDRGVKVRQGVVELRGWALGSDSAAGTGKLVSRLPVSCRGPNRQLAVGDWQFQ